MAATEWPDGPERIFYSDDPETGNVTGNGSEVNALSELLDLHYPTTRPNITANGSTLAEYRRSQLRSVEMERDTSKFLPDSERKNSSVIQDAHVTLLGTVGGARPVLPASTTDEDVDAYIPSGGQVLNYLDYRIEGSNMPDDSIEESEITVDNKTVTKRITKDYEIDYGASGVRKRVVRINGDKVGSETGDPEGRVIDYDDASGDGVVTLEIQATITVAGSVTTTTTVGGNVTDRDTDSRTFDSVTVSDTMAVRVVDDQRLEIRQRAVVFEGPKPSIVTVNFDGPLSVAERKIWSLLRFGEGAVVSNNWGVYSTTQYNTGYVTDGDEEREFAFPHVLAVKFTSTDERPSGGALPSAPANGATVRSVWQSNLSDERPPVGENINFTTSAPGVVRWMRVEGTQAPIDGGVDLFGRHIEVKDEQNLTVHEAAITLEFLGENRTKVRLYDPDTGEGIQGRTIWLDGAVPASVQTNATGAATFNRTDQFVRARFDGDPWRDDLISYDLSGTYYQSETREETRVPLSALSTSFIALVERIVLIFPFIFGLYMIRSLNKDV